MAAAYVVLCPGQGVQSPDMFELAEADHRGRQALAEFSDALDLDLVKRARSGLQLFDNGFAQPAMVAASSAAWAALSPLLPAPLLLAGYSVGEVSAWSCSGVWNAATAADVAATRGRLMTALAPSGCGMLAVRGLTSGALMKEADGLFLAIVNDSDHLVLAGADAALETARQRLNALGAWTRRLDVQVPSHTPLMTAAAAAFRAFIATIPTGRLTAPVLRGVDGAACRRPEDAGDALARAICEPIRWDDCLQSLVEAGVRVVLELGPGRTLVKLCNEVHPMLTARSVADFRSLDGVATWVQRQLSA